MLRDGPGGGPVPGHRPRLRRTALPARTSSPAPFGRNHFSAGVRDRRSDRPGLRHARRVRHLHLFHNEPKKIHGDGRSGQPVPGPQRQPHRTPPPTQVSSRASARWRVGRASPSGTPSGRVPLPIAGRFRCPAQTPPGSIPSLCRDPESFVVCSSIFSHFYARRRFLSHPTQEIAVGHACSPSCKMMETCSESMT